MDDTARLHHAGRHAVGVAGRFELGPMAEALRASRLSWYPLIALAVLGGVEALFIAALAGARGSVSTALGVPNLGLFVYIDILGIAAGGLVALRVTTRPGLRGRVAVGAGGLAVTGLLIASVARNAWALAIAALVAGLGSGVAHVVHRPLLLDHYRPEVRVRALSAYTAGIMIGAAVASVAVAGADVIGLTWRSGMLAVAGVGAIAVVVTFRLNDAVEATWESRVISALVGGDGAAEPATGVSTGERMRQVVATSAARPLLVAAAAFGVLVVTAPPYLFTLWRERWRMGNDAAVGLYAALCLASALGLALFGRRGELAFRADPARMLRMASRAAGLGAVALPLAAASGSFAVMVVAFAAGFAGLAVLLPAASVALLSVVRPGNRPTASLALGLAVVQGGLTGTFLMQAFATRYGLRWAFLVVGAAAFGAAGAAARAARTIDDDLDDTVASMIEEHELHARRAAGQHLPLLGVRRVEFSYGPVQVLFDVDLTVDDGEMVALLGTNGAGKSTLLRLISGISVPSRGSVHFRGLDITYARPDERVRLGISQVPGGRAVFGPMTVAENLRVFGHTYGRNRRAIEAGIDASFAAFPALAARADNQAATLSGGEQQMLGIAKAFVARPQLLLIDELSLGLAPIVVAELLDTVRQINQQGTAVVVVEQSVNIALTLVDHAYFMEKGEIRFDGRADELARRPDLLRSVFLEGVR